MEKQGHDLNILAANTTNYFDFFIRTIDFLKEVTPFVKDTSSKLYILDC